MLGFGGAFTDAAGINIARLSQAAQENLMRYFFFHTVFSEAARRYHLIVVSGVIQGTRET